MERDVGREGRNIGPFQRTTLYKLISEAWCTLIREHISLVRRARNASLRSFARGNEDEVVDASIVANKVAHNVVNVYVIHEKPF